MENKRMTWDEIVAKYPDQWVGLIEEEGAGPNVTSAIVVCADKDADKTALLIFIFILASFTFPAF